MFRRRDFGALGLSALAVVTARSAVFAQEGAKGQDAPRHDDMFRRCAAACNDCQRECDSCATHCGRMLLEGHKDHHLTLQTCQDCADICVAAAQMVARRGPFSNLVCKACEEACAKCAVECEKFKDDQHMRRCAEECRKCEKACREMLKHSEAKPT